MSETMNVVEGGKAYSLRKLKNKDTWTGARIVARVLADPRLPMTAAQIMGNPALGEAERNTSLMISVAGALMEHAPEEFEAFLMDLAGLKRNEWDELPPEATFDILSALMEKEDFLPIARSAIKLSGVAKKAFSSWQNQSNSNGDGPTPNS